MPPPNQRMKLAWRGGRLKGNGSVLMAGRRTTQLMRDSLGCADTVPELHAISLALDPHRHCCHGSRPIGPVRCVFQLRSSHVHRGRSLSGHWGASRDSRSVRAENTGLATRSPDRPCMVLCLGRSPSRSMGTGRLIDVGEHCHTLCSAGWNRGLAASASASVPAQPNQRMKLSWRGGRVIEKGSILMAAAAPRSLSAIR